MSVRPAGSPVAANCLARRSYDETARLLNLGCAGSVDATVANPSIAQNICLKEGIMVLLIVLQEGMILKDFVE